MSKRWKFIVQVSFESRGREVHSYEQDLKLWEVSFSIKSYADELFNMTYNGDGILNSLKFHSR